MSWQLELPYRDIVEDRPATWQSSDGLTHACDGTTLLPGEVIVWTCCGLDVPVHLAGEELPHGPDVSCPKCKKIGEDRERRERWLRWKVDRRASLHPTRLG